MTGAVPYRLLDDASWATQGCAPLFRSDLTFAARRALATGIRLSTCTAAEAATAERRDPLAADLALDASTARARLTRLLLVSDLDDVRSVGS